MRALQRILRKWVSDGLWHIRIATFFFQAMYRTQGLESPSHIAGPEIVQTFSLRAMASAAQIGASQPERQPTSETGTHMDQT